MRVVAISDTHVRRGGRRVMPKAAVDHLRTADAILHAGDVLEQWFLDDLAEIAPVHAVLGNNDVSLRLPERLEVDLDGVRVAMVHDSGPRTGRPGRLRRRFPDAAVVVFGHSHIPCNETGVDGQLLFNPGSPTERRTQPEPTFGLLELSAGSVVRSEIVVV